MAVATMVLTACLKSTVASRSESMRGCIVCAECNGVAVDTMRALSVVRKAVEDEAARTGSDAALVLRFCALGAQRQRGLPLHTEKGGALCARLKRIGLGQWTDVLTEEGFDIEKDNLDCVKSAEDLPARLPAYVRKRIAAEARAMAAEAVEWGGYTLLHCLNSLPPRQVHIHGGGTSSHARRC